MPLPIRNLPVAQNWDCQVCGNCCREYQVPVTGEERRRISAQGWDRDPELVGVALFERKGRWWSRRYRLAHRPDEACVFLSREGRCRIHEKFGPEAKPLACRLYPFIFVPAGDHWRIGMRYACPSAAANRGKPVQEHLGLIRAFAAALESQAKGDVSAAPAPPLQSGQRLGWEDLHQVTGALVDILHDRRTGMDHRLRRCMALAALCRQARFDKVTGPRLREFLSVLANGLTGEVPADPELVPAPRWMGRVLFRQVLALYVRKDHGPGRGLAIQGRKALLGAAWQFGRGTGPVPRVHADIPETTFERVEAARWGRLPEEAERALERYYTVKVSSLQFCGAMNFGLPFWAGLHSLVLTFPVIRWLARALSSTATADAMVRAIGIVDNNFAFNRLLGTARQRLGLSLLVRQGELEKLVAWYAR